MLSIHPSLVAPVVALLLAAGCQAPQCASAAPNTRFVDVLNEREQRRQRAAAESHGGGIIATDTPLHAVPVANDNVHPPAPGGKHVADVEEHWIEQRLDHFSSVPNEKPARTYRQRYFYSGRYVNRAHRPGGRTGASSPPPTAPPAPTYAFLCVGGEGPALTETVLVNSDHCTGDMIELARRLHGNDDDGDGGGGGANVHMFALEHRYYGSSYPEFPAGSSAKSSPVTNENLVYLSSRQALADLAHFVATVRSDPLFFRSVSEEGEEEEEEVVKFVTFGGSYPGMLAAWARLKFPHLIYAAVSNSAPVQATLDFSAYNDRVAYDLCDEDVGGSDECLGLFVDGHAEIADLLASSSRSGGGDGGGDGRKSSLSEEEDGREYVAELFNVCGGATSLVDPKNVSLFLGDGVVYVPAQANDPSCQGDCIQQLCSSLIEANDRLGSPIESLAAVSKQQRKEDHGDSACVTVDWAGTIRYLASPAAQEGGLRSWLWQTCTEFGFYQTCESASSCPYGRGLHTVGLDLEICDRAFGIDEGEVARNVKDTLNYYGGWDLEGSRILFTNGEVDPWAMMGVIDGQGTTTLPTLWVKGASHHFWTHEVKESDGEGVKHAREMIHRQVIEWITMSSSDADGERTSVNHSFDEQTAQA